MMADFQNSLISRIFSVLSSGVLDRTTLMSQFENVPVSPIGI